MKLFIAIIFTIFCHQSIADAFFTIGKTTSFDNSLVTNQDSGEDSMYLIGVSGINVDPTSRYYDKAGFFFSYGFGQYAYNDYNDNQRNIMASAGLTFPFLEQSYLKMGMSVTESNVNDKWFRKNGLILGFGNVFNKKYSVDLSYDKSLNVLSFLIGYRWM